MAEHECTFRGVRQVCLDCGRKRPRNDAYSNTGLFYTVVQSPEPWAPEFTDGTEGEWFRVNTVRSLSESSEYGESARRIGGYLRRDRELARHTGMGGSPTPRAPLGEMDPDFLNLDLSVIQAEAEQWDWVGTGRRVIASEFHDLVAHMNLEPEPVLDEHGTERARFKWNRHQDPETREWVDAFWTWQALAERLARFAWNWDFFEKKRIPWAARTGRVWTGRFTYLGDSVLNAVVVQRFSHSEERRRRGGGTEIYPVWEWIAFLRESMGTEMIEVRGRKIPSRVWKYHASKTFSTRESAEAFAERLEAKARLEAELVLETRRSMGERVHDTWDRDEYPYDPSVLVTFEGGGSYSDEY